MSLHLDILAGEHHTFWWNQPVYGLSKHHTFGGTNQCKVFLAATEQ
jgi:hypothetical protein